MRSDIKPGIKIIINKKNGHLSQNPYLSRVEDVLDQHLLLIHTPIVRESFVRIPVGEKYSFLFYTEEGLLQATGKILKYCMQNNADLMLVKMNDYQPIQRRLFYRLKLNLDFAFMRTTDLTGDETDENVPVYKGIIKNISGGGLCFVSDLMLMQNEHILCTLTLNCPDINIEGKVLSIEPLEDCHYRYAYRMEFINIDSVQQEKIVQYVFSMQWEMIKRIKRQSEYGRQRSK